MRYKPFQKRKYFMGFDFHYNKQHTYLFIIEFRGNRDKCGEINDAVDDIKNN